MLYGKNNSGSKTGLSVSRLCLKSYWRTDRDVFDLLNYNSFLDRRRWYGICIREYTRMPPSPLLETSACKHDNAVTAAKLSNLTVALLNIKLGTFFWSQDVLQCNLLWHKAFWGQSFQNVFLPSGRVKSSVLYPPCLLMPYRVKILFPSGCSFAASAYKTISVQVNQSLRSKKTTTERLRSLRGGAELCVGLKLKGGEKKKGKKRLSPLNPSSGIQTGDGKKEASC